MENEREMELLREQLTECERDLWRYKGQENSKNPALAANYRHKERQIADIRARIAEMESKHIKKEGKSHG